MRDKPRRKPRKTPEQMIAEGWTRDETDPNVWVKTMPNMFECQCRCQCRCRREQ